MSERLESVIAEPREGIESDFKQAFPWKPKSKDDSIKKACIGLVKDVVALANTRGGQIYIGFREESGQFYPDGVPPDMLDKWETTIFCDYINTCVSPPIDASVRVEQHQGLYFVVISVPPFEVEPHLTLNKFSEHLDCGRILIRTAGAKTTVITEHHEMRIFLERAIQRRQDSLLGQIRTLFTSRQYGSEVAKPIEWFEEKLAAVRAQLPTDLAATSYREVWAYPESLDQKLYAASELEDICRNASRNFTGMPFLYLPRKVVGKDHELYRIDGALETNMIETAFDRRVFWRFTTSGLFYHVHRTRRFEDERAMIDIDYLWREAALAIDCFVKLYEENLPDDERITFGIRWCNIKGRRLGNSDKQEHLDEIYAYNFKVRQPDVEHIRTLPLIEWKTGLIDHAAETYEHFCHLFNFPGTRAEVVKPKIKKLFQHRYR